MSEKRPSESDAEPCAFGTKAHDRRDHYGRGWPHNPWSESCAKNMPGEPTCGLAYCPTCDSVLHAAAQSGPKGDHVTRPTEPCSEQRPHVHADDLLVLHVEGLQFPIEIIPDGDVTGPEVTP